MWLTVFLLDRAVLVFSHDDVNDIHSWMYLFIYSMNMYCIPTMCHMLTR